MKKGQNKGSRHWNFGRHTSETTKEKIRKSLDKGKRIKGNCLICQKEFIYYPSLRTKIYCSEGCYHISQRGLKRPQHSAFMKEFLKTHKISPNGHKLSDKEKRDISSRMLKRWADKNDYLNSKEYRQSISDRDVALGKLGRGIITYNKGYARGRQGHYNINGKDIYFRSLWEANYALYLDFLIKNHEIKSWEFEPQTFWFEKIKRGIRSYLPDFKVYKNDDSFEYHEVKGWMDKKSVTKLKRMKKYYPNIRVIVIDEDSYKDIKKKLGKAIGFFV